MAELAGGWCVINEATGYNCCAENEGGQEHPIQEDKGETNQENQKKETNVRRGRRSRRRWRSRRDRRGQHPCPSTITNRDLDHP